MQHGQKAKAKVMGKEVAAEETLRVEELPEIQSKGKTDDLKAQAERSPNCDRGKACNFWHPPTCKFWTEGKCTTGQDGIYPHRKIQGASPAATPQSTPPPSAPSTPRKPRKQRRGGNKDNPSLAFATTCCSKHATITAAAIALLNQSSSAALVPGFLPTVYIAERTLTQQFEEFTQNARGGPRACKESHRMSQMGNSNRFCLYWCAGT